MNRSTLETFLGAFVILVTLGFLLFVLQLSDFSSKEGTLYKARFLKVGGLEKGNEVRIGGVKVGTIITRDLDAVNFEAIVKFSVNSSIKLPSDTKAMVIGQGFLGEKYLFMLFLLYVLLYVYLICFISMSQGHDNMVL